MTGITYELFKSTNNKASFNILSSSTAANDTAINFSGTDALPPPGASYFYFVKASMPGVTTVYTDTIEISSIPTIVTTTSSLTNFLQGSTAPSSAQSYIVSGSNLLNDIVITAPANYEVSLDNATWNNTITLTQTAGTVANTIVYARLNAPSAGNFSGTIVHSTIGVSTTHTKNIAVNGNTQSTPLLFYNVVQQWNLTTNNADDAAVRATGLTATIPTLKRLTLSNGTQVPAVPAYSTLYGQAIAPSSAGDGMWGAAAGGSGSALSRTLYQQFTIKPDANYSVRIDSFVASLGYYGSVSGTKIAVAYSKSNFTADSSNVTGGRDVGGLTLPGTANGAFTSPIVILATSNSGNTAEYALALNAGNGVQLNAGDSLTIRIYFSCGSTSAGRYAVVKNVQAKGLVPVNLPVKLMKYEVRSINEKQILNTWITSSEINTSHFNIQKSIDGKSFETVGKVAAKGISSYSFHDPLTISLSPSTLYYRLQIVDKDGSKSYSEIKRVTLTEKQETTNVNIFPNPAKNFVNIHSKGAKEILITDYLGKIIQRFNNPTEHRTVNIKQFTKGIYIIKVLMNNGEIKTEKLVIE